MLHILEHRTLVRRRLDPRDCQRKIIEQQHEILLSFISDVGLNAQTQIGFLCCNCVFGNLQFDLYDRLLADQPPSRLCIFDRNPLGLDEPLVVLKFRSARPLDGNPPGDT
jgi:hypothetical protein